MNIKPEIKAALGGAAEQLECSLAVLSAGSLTENQRFHLDQLKSVLTTDAPQQEEPL